MTGVAASPVLLPPSKMARDRHKVMEGRARTKTQEHTVSTYLLPVSGNLSAQLAPLKAAAYSGTKMKWR